MTENEAASRRQGSGLVHWWRSGHRESSIEPDEAAPFGQAVGTEIGLVFRNDEVAARGADRIGAYGVLRGERIAVAFHQNDVLHVACIGPRENLGCIAVAGRQGPMIWSIKFSNLQILTML